MNRGQFSIEFIVVFGALVMIVAATTIPLYQNSRESVGKIKNMTLAKEAANKISQSINSVYIEGPGAQRTINYTLPSGIENIKIGNSKGSDNHADLLFYSSRWKEDNILSVNTLLHKNNHPNIIIENRENLFNIVNNIDKISDNLDVENISTHLRNKYNSEGYTLSADDKVSISVVESGQVWLLYDEKEVYDHEIKKEGGELTIFNRGINSAGEHEVRTRLELFGSNDLRIRIEEV